MNRVEPKQTQKALKKQELIQGVHYYYERGFMVFTEAYHLARGYCCDNGCRHCPYKNKKS